MSVHTGDITRLEVDAVVNAANPELMGGGGVDGAIHRAAGPELLEACRKLGGCKIGDAKVTPGFNLPAEWVIHTVGPLWRYGSDYEADLLASCYHRSLEEAVAIGASTVAFPAISTGAYRFPPDRAAIIAVETVRAFLETDATVGSVLFCCFDEASAERHRAALAGAV